MDARTELEGSASGVRVILVGRTGVDAALRRSPGFELVRVRTPLEAIGELASPGTEALEWPPVVVLSSDAVRALDGGSANGAGSAGSRRDEFVRAARLADARTRVLHVAERDEPRPGYDGVVNASSPARSIEAAVRAPGASDSPAPELPQPRPAAPAALPPPSDETDDPSAADLAGDVADLSWGDAALVRRLMRGHDITDAAVELVRTRLGGADVVFVSSEGPGEPTSIARGWAQAAVAWRGAQFGWLRGRGTPAEALAPHAAWLGAWLAMRNQHVQLRDAAFTDALTGAYNRRYFEHFLSSVIEQARPKRHPVTLLMFDIDNFKVFNDRHGHAAGDAILREVVKLLGSVVRPTDKVCRIGGDEFVVVFYEPEGPRTRHSHHPRSIHEIAQRFQQAIAAHPFPKLGREAPGQLSISGGLATFPWDGQSADELLATADRLAMDGKSRGKNVIVLGPGAERLSRDG